MTEPTPTPDKQNLPVTPDSGLVTPDSGQDKNSSTPERDGFFRKVRRGLQKPLHPSEVEEIVVDMEGKGDK